MRRLNFLFTAVLAIAGLSFIASCTPNETTNVKPKLNFISEGASITADKTVDAGAPLLFKVNGVSNTSTKKNLKTLRVQSFTNNNPNVDTTVSIKKDSYTGSFNYHAPATASTEEKFTFTLTDNAGETDVVNITITTEAAAPPAPTPNAIETYNSVLLAGQGSSHAGSFYDAETNTVYKSADARTNAAKVDLIFAYGNTNKYYIGAPSNTDINTSHTTMATGWSTKNATKLMTTAITAAEFDAMTDDANFPTITGNATKVNMLAAGTVFAFETVAGKVGLVKVVSTSGTSATTRAIRIAVKIQK